MIWSSRTTARPRSRRASRLRTRCRPERWRNRRQRYSTTWPARTSSRAPTLAGIPGAIAARHGCRVAGESMPYAKEMEQTFGIRPRWHDEKQFAEGRGLLDEALPGTGQSSRALPTGSRRRRSRRTSCSRRFNR